MSAGADIEGLQTQARQIEDDSEVISSADSACAPPNEYALEIEAPDVSAHQAGNTGIDYVSTFDSGAPGPHVMVSAVVHGNELCGAIVLDELLLEGVRPRAGKLTTAFVNTGALLSFDTADPTASRFVDEDFNRLWNAEVLDGVRDSAELRRARVLRPILDDVDLLLDIHSMQHATEPLMMCGPLEKGRALARALGSPAHVVSDAGHAAGRRMRDYADFSDPDSEKNSLLIECGQHWERRSVSVAFDVTARFLRQTGVVAPEFWASRIAPSPAQQRVIEVTQPVTIKNDGFRFADDYRGLEVIERAGTVIGWDGHEAVKTPFDDCVLIMPSRRLNAGASAVRLGRYLPPD
ncbi:MAG: succinylglutamate desuccinylase [Gammaproteobacteria bacterium]